MAMNLSVDLNDATFGDLAALVAAAKKAGATKDTPISLNDGQLFVSVDVASSDAPLESSYSKTNVIDEDGNELYEAGRRFADTVRTSATEGSDAALRLIAELLKSDRRRF